MHIIYQNAYGTIIAADAIDCHEGFLKPDIPMDQPPCSLPFSIPFRCPNEQLDTIVLGEFRESHPTEQPINQRAWTLQKRLVSSRTLTYTHNPRQLSWDCQTLLDSHGGIKPGRQGWRSHAHAIGRLHDNIFSACADRSGSTTLDKVSTDL